MSETVKRYDFEGILLPGGCGEFVQYADYQKLESDLELKNHLLKECNGIHGKLAQLESDNKRLREALEFYASLDNWRKLPLSGMGMFDYAAQNDGGHKARQALNHHGGEDEAIRARGEK